MSNVIEIQNISKVYRLGVISSGTVANDLNQWWARIRRRPDPLAVVGAHHERRVGESYWALDDVSFNVRDGEVLGVIGRNGAGKSTLLKILSQVTAPTSGRIKMRGRVASLLEVGTGFHPDLSGRDNVYLNGSILGMTKSEIRRNFDEIVAFSECETFIDTPVKRYSSGMYVRLAFAVAAHLQPEILIVDEVLAVGDAQFQRKCLGKMREASHGGRTVLFVSHSMAAVAALCGRAVYLKDGRVEMDGDTRDVIAAYQAASPVSASDAISLDEALRTGTGKARFRRLRVEAADTNGSSEPVISIGSDVMLEMDIECAVDIEPANVAIVVNDSSGYRLIDVNTALHGEFLQLRAGQAATVRFLLRDLRLKAGAYTVELCLGRSNVEVIDYISCARVIEIAPDLDAQHSEEYPGAYRCDFTHSIDYAKSEPGVP